MTPLVAVYATIWMSLALFVAGEWAAGRALPGASRRLHAAGIALCLGHILLTFAVVHGWSHAAAVAATAAQTRAVFGIEAGASVYANYMFVAVWLADTQWWRPRAAGASLPSGALWLLRGFYLVFLIDAGVVFAAGRRRGLGALLIVSLVLAWRPRRRG